MDSEFENLVHLIYRSSPLPTHVAQDVAQGKTLDLLAWNICLKRISFKPTWWKWGWPSFWPFVESDKSLRSRMHEAMKFGWENKKPAWLE